MAASLLTLAIAIGVVVVAPPSPCPIIQQANAASGTPGLRNGTSIGAVLFLGHAEDCGGCQAACGAHSGCHSWVWWYPDEPVPGFSKGCYGRTDDHWPPAEQIRRARHHVCSGMNCANPPGKVPPPPPPPPPPTGPVATPSGAQLAWHDHEVGAMITFNMQTYGLLPVGTHRTAPPASVFNPDKLDTDAWVQAAKSFGAKYAVLTASHRSGFALWPTQSHNYSVAFSGQAGRDILREFVASCRKFGLSPGVFWTQRFNDYFGVANSGIVDPGRAVQPVSQALYDSMMGMQLTELAAYGFTEVWVNGKIEGDAAAVLTKQLARLFPNATCHSCGGVPTKSQIRWVGTGEMGIAAQPSWSSTGIINGTPSDGAGHHGNPHGSMYAPPSCDAVLREHCWFGGNAYPPGHCKLSSTPNLVRKYLTSVGRNCNLILNIAPDTHGVVGAEEVAAYDAMGKAVSSLFAAPVASTTAPSLPMNVSTGVIEWLLPGAGVAAKGGNYSLVLEEDLTDGQLIGSYGLLCRAAESWQPCPMGSLGGGVIASTLFPGIGHKRILMLALDGGVDGVRVVVHSNFATGAQLPALRKIALHDWNDRAAGGNNRKGRIHPTAR